MNETFYDGGLRFECTQCHACCRHDPGFVFLGRSDLARLQKFLGLDQTSFLAQYTRWVTLENGPVLSLKEKKNYDCIFWDKGCTVYDARPIQCSTYPFWKNQVLSFQNWKWEGRFCPGIDRGPVISALKIQAALSARQNEPALTPDTL